MSPHPRKAFTLIELVMVVLSLALLAAVAIPNFIDMRSDAKNAATKGHLGTFRSAIAIATAAIKLREDPTTTTPKYPTRSEMHGNAFDGSHPILSGTAILDPAHGKPRNPWSLASTEVTWGNAVFDAEASYGDKRSDWHDSSGCTDAGNGGWMYIESKGEFWAKTCRNGISNTYDYSVDCMKTKPSECCY